MQVHEFGGPEVLVYEDVPRPVPGPGEVLVRVHAAALNPPDWYRRVGYTNFPEDVRPPAPPLPFIPGSDVSGTVVGTGPGVTAFREGDAVFGLVRFPTIDNAARGYAEYVTSPVEHLALKPETVDHVHAAGVPMAGLTAYQFLFDHVRLGWDKTVLVNGAGGGVGHFLVQLAKTRRAHVIGVASGRHEAFLHKLGVDRFIDYTTTSAGETVRDVDHVFDTVGGPDGHRFLPVLKRGGTLMPVFYGDYHQDRADELGFTFLSGQVRSDGAQMAELARLIDDGRVQVGIDAVYPLADAPAAHERAERGHIQGKIVLRVAED
nr:NADP-dependent oxidoreductase [Actinomadura rugatobispora]